MSDFRIVLRGGDLEAAKKAIEGVGGYRPTFTHTRYTDSGSETSDLLHVHLDAADEDDARGVVMASGLPEGCSISQIHPA